MKDPEIAVTQRYLEESFTRLMKDHMDFAFVISSRFLTNSADIQDAIQNAFMKAWKSFQQFDPEKATFSTWLFQIIRNECLDRWRAARKHQDVTLAEVREIPDRDLNQQMETIELYERILLLAEKLPDTQKSCFFMRDVQGLSVREVTERTRQSENSVKSNLHLARKKLKKWIEEEDKY